MFVRFIELYSYLLEMMGKHLSYLPGARADKNLSISVQFSKRILFDLNHSHSFCRLEGIDCQC